MRNTIVTGTDSGLGLALLERLGKKEGSTIGPVYGTTYLYDNWRKGDGGHFYLRYGGDGVDKHVKEVARSIRDDVGTVDILIHNASINGLIAVTDLDLSHMRMFHEINVAGPILFTKELIRNGCLIDESVVLFIVSEASWKPMRYSLAYNLSKAALKMAVEGLARELTVTTGITFVGVSPGLIEGTEMTSKVMRDAKTVRGWSHTDFMEYWKKGSVTGRPHKVEDLADLIGSILDNDGIRSMSGAVMNLVS